MITERLVANIKRGIKGLNVGISTGLPVIDSKIYGLQKKSLIVLGADTSGGKTSFALDIFIYNILKNKGEREVNILYYSFEMASEILFAKLLSRHIYEEFQEIITYEEILSLTAPLSLEKLKYVKDCISWLKEVEKHITIYDKALSPNGIYATSKEWLRKFGEFVEIDEHREDFIPNNSEAYLIGLIDHVGLISGQGTKKERIDLTVDYQIYFRNKCNMTWVDIQQMNRNAKSMERRTGGYELYQLDDFKDTSGTVEGADIVIALYYPYREKIARCEGYPIQNILKRRFRLFQLLKNRYGLADYNKGLVFYGEIGLFRELPKPEDISDYEPYLELSTSKIQDSIPIDDENKNEYTFKL